MANYFDRLAGRTLGIIPVAQPLVPPITAAAPHLELAAPLEVKTDVTQPSVEDGRSAMHWSLHPSLPPPEETDFTMHRASPPNSRTAVNRDTAAARAIVHSIPASEPESPATASTWMRSVRSAHRDARTFSPENVIEENNFEGDAVARAHQQPPLVTEEPILGRVLARPTEATPSQPPFPQSQSHRSQPDGFIDSAAAPTIRITIGRVDVRAQFPPSVNPPSPARPGRASALSLEQYEKQRREGRR